ncbi:MAG: hypothetical protein HC888_19175 [Candidatus Competibacteraceae bacterium]|nr:hypothetical protein [Candidatus Competibacteraceae bacterium]
MDADTVARVRAAIKDRALWFALLYRAFKEALPEDKVRELSRKAIFEFGRMKAASDPAEFCSRAWVQRHVDKGSAAVFDSDIEIHDDHANQRMKHCALVDAWKELGCTPEEVELFCDIAMEGDRGPRRRPRHPHGARRNPRQGRLLLQSHGLRRKGMNLYLCGMIGSGKTTIGRRLAETTGLSFTDLDQEMERRLGHSFHRLVAEQGWLAFRELEYAICKDFSRLDHHVVCLGGGTVRYQWNVDVMRGSGPIVLLELDRGSHRAGASGRPSSGEPGNDARGGHHPDVDSRAAQVPGGRGLRVPQRRETARRGNRRFQDAARGS